MAGRLDAGPDAGQEVRLPAVPLGVFSAAGGYVEQAVRELALTLLPATAPAVHRARQILGADGLADLQHQFCDLAEHAADYMPLRDIVARELAAAAGGGLASTDVYVRLPAECARTSVALTQLLDAAERLSAAGLLAVPPPDPRVSAFRRWYLAEIHRQLSDGGRPPPAATGRAPAGHEGHRGWSGLDPGELSQPGGELPTADRFRTGQVRRSALAH